MSKTYFLDEDGDFSINSLFLLLWESKALISISAVILIAISAFSLRFLDETWTARAVLMPTAANAATGGAAGNSLVSLVGVSLGGKAGVSGAQVAQEVLKTRDFFKIIYNNDEHLIKLSAVNGYENGENLFNNEIYDSSKQLWIKKPTFEQAFSHYRRGIIIDYKWELGGFINASFTHSSPSVARDILSFAIDALNDSQRDKEIAKSSANLEFLQEEISKVVNADLKRAAAGLMQNELKSIMFAKTRKDFIIEPLDSVYQPTSRTSPRPLIFIALCSFIGLALICLLLMVRKLQEEDN